MSGVTTRTVADDEAGMRLDRWFHLHYPSVRHGELEKFLRKGQVRVDGGRSKANRRLDAGATVRIPPLADNATPVKKAPPAPAKREDARAKLRQMTIYEDDALLVLNKPFGLAVQGGAKTTTHVDAMLSAIGHDENRPRLTHRLDRDTGGLLVIAKTRSAAAALGGAFQRHEVEKTYWALVLGAPRPREGRIDMKIAQRMVIAGERLQERVTPADGEEARKALTDYQTISDVGGAVSFLALRPVTGRKHQLRVHCAAIGSPIVGDRKYGGPGAAVDGVGKGLHLFCREMTFRHPKSGARVSYRAPLVGEMARTWDFFSLDKEAATDWSEAPS